MLLHRWIHLAEVLRTSMAVERVKTLDETQTKPKQWVRLNWF